MSTLDVLVVGAGPTGLTLACEAHRHGIRCRVVEVLEKAETYSKAAVVHSRTMEVFAQMGLAEKVLDRSRLVHGLNAYSGGKRVAHVPFEGQGDTPYPFPCGISQHDTERLLADHLASLGGAIERGKKLTSLEEVGDIIRARVAGGTGAEETIEARWVVGCDGAHSAVRKALGFTFEGAAYTERLVQSDIRIEWPTKVEGDEILAFLHEDGPLIAFPLFTDGRYRLIALLPKDAPDEEPTVEMFQRLVDERGPAGTRVSDPAWMIPFRIHHRRTNLYRKGRGFVAGDAAHIHSPVGGQGMNTGIQDAHNLAWKLALVARGAARESILDSYAAERQPIAKALLDMTDTAMQGLELVVGLRSPIATALRNQLITLVTSAGFVRTRMPRAISMLELNVAKSPIVKQDRVPVWNANLRSSRETEDPSLADWAAFGDAPAPGYRALDAAIDPPQDGKNHVFELLRSPRHVLFLFDGAAATTEGYANLDTIARAVRDRYGAWIDVHVVVPAASRPSSLAWDGSTLLDAAGTIHQRYGARSECLYLVRPDGYVAYRCQPAKLDRLMEYLGSIFV